MRPSYRRHAPRRVVAAIHRKILRLPTPSPQILVLRRALYEIAALDLPYVFGGGHGPLPGATRGTDPDNPLVGLDCSGAIRWALVKAGLLDAHAECTTETLESWGLPGMGYFATVWARDSGGVHHAVIQMRYLGTPAFWEAGHTGMIVGFLRGGFITTAYHSRRRP